VARVNEPRAIPIHFIPPAAARTGNERAVLAEILAHLQLLAETGATAAIDLLALPLSDADRGWLQETLGHGEVRAEVDAAGVSEVLETAFTGVWWVTHRNADGQTVAELIEITLLPEILRASAADAAHGCGRLERLLQDFAAAQS
jgi:hydrogenase-1 operon protein HyaF